MEAQKQGVFAPTSKYPSPAPPKKSTANLRPSTACCVGCFKSVQVLFNGIEAVPALTLTILKWQALF